MIERTADINVPTVTFPSFTIPNINKYYSFLMWYAMLLRTVDVRFQLTIMIEKSDVP